MRTCTLNLIMKAHIIGLLLLPTVAFGFGDLQVATFTGPATVYPGVPVGEQVTLVIHNAGPDDITSSFTVGFYISSDAIITSMDQLLVDGREVVASIAAGQSLNVQLSVDAFVGSGYPLGTAYLGVMVDEFSQIVEETETNNTAAALTFVDDSVSDQTMSLESIKALYR